jgi:phospholipid-binding lipoprotein MlaA
MNTNSSFSLSHLACGLRLRTLCSAGVIAISLLLGACATTSAPNQAAGGPAGTPARVASPADPLEPFNRVVFSINDALDRVFLKPVAQGYEAVVPEVFRGMVTNFFGNLGDAWTAVNQLAQGKPVMAFQDASRVVINSFFGFFGIADVAREMGFEKNREDFGQTLGVWGLPSGPYLVLPLFGPSSVRDASAFPIDFLGDPVLYASEGARPFLGFGRLVNTRAVLLPAENVVQGAALDKYTFFRDTYLQRRRNMVFDGNPPQPKD